MRYYLRLLLCATLVLVPLTVLCIWVLDEPVAQLVHRFGKPLKPLAEWFMAGINWLWDLMHAPSPIGVPLLWLLFPLLFLGSRVLRWKHATIWLVVLVAWVSSEVLANVLKLYFNRPRPEVLWLHTAPNAGFWQPFGQYDAFPSGHTAWAAGIVLPLALRFLKLRPWLFSVLAVIGLGRVLLEVHWLSDVLASIYLALVLTCLCEIGTWWLRPRARSHAELAVTNAT
jgi:membrane-associated phospholipid phosphatase